MYTKIKLIKIILLGDSGTGKTSLMNRYISNKFTHHYRATIGADFSTKELEVNNKKCILQIWDTAGQERFNSLSEMFYRGADGCVLVFDVTSRKSFDKLDDWLRGFKIQANLTDSDDFPLIVIGNKIDKHELRIIFPKEIQNWCKNNNIKYYFECSAMTTINVNIAFEKLAEISEQYNKNNEEIDEKHYFKNIGDIEIDEPNMFSLQNVSAKCCNI